MSRFFGMALLTLAAAFISACATPTQTIPTVTPTTTPTLPPTATPTVTITPTAAPTATITPTPTPEIVLHSPLEGITLQELPEIDANVYAPPALGKEDGHHGVDFSYWRYKDKIGMLGLPVESVLPGTVAMADSNHKPYGNAVIIETPLKNLPQSWIATLNLPAAEPLWDMDTRLYCPKPAEESAYNTSERSLYLLYAHLENPPEVKPGQAVQAGDIIGLVGHSGNAINDHLHLEVRVGPAGVKIASMDHYDNGASDEAMWNYCTWRISGHFKLIDPMLLLSLKP